MIGRDWPGLRRFSFATPMQGERMRLPAPTGFRPVSRKVCAPFLRCGTREEPEFWIPISAIHDIENAAETTGAIRESLPTAKISLPLKLCASGQIGLEPVLFFAAQGRSSGCESFR
jgi:hypothetical protein